MNKSQKYITKISCILNLTHYILHYINLQPYKNNQICDIFRIIITKHVMLKRSHRRCSVKKCSKKFWESHRKTPVLESPFNKVTSLRVVSCEICEIFKITYFKEHLRTTASECLMNIIQKQGTASCQWGNTCPKLTMKTLRQRPWTFFLIALLLPLNRPSTIEIPSSNCSSRY